MLSWFILFIIIVFLLQIIISAIMYFKQDRLIYKPEKIPLDYPFDFKNDFEEITLKTEDKNTLNGLLFKVNEPKGVILYFHSFSANVQYWTQTPNFLNQLGYDVLFMDYRTFGKSTGKFEEPVIYFDAELWYSYLLEIYPENKITVYGRCLGGSVASYIASVNNPVRLILEAPFYSMPYYLKHHYPLLPIIQYIVKYKLNTASFIRNVKCKTFIFYSDKDEYVPSKNVIKLHNLIKNNADLVLIEGVTHYSLQNNEVYLSHIKKIFTHDG